MITFYEYNFIRDDLVRIYNVKRIDLLINLVNWSMFKHSGALPIHQMSKQFMHLNFFLESR